MQLRERVAILALGTAVPAYRNHQTELAEWMGDGFAQQPAMRRLLRSVFANAGVETRYACIDDFQRPVAQSRFSPGQSPANSPTTAERMAIYERASPPLGAAAAQRALTHWAESAGFTLATATQAITHLVIVSCTGFFAPGLDLALARLLDLPSTIGRTIIGFMGCSAAFNGLRTAAQIVQGQPTARVLVVCVELSSLHIQPEMNREQLVAASLFADGAAACVVGAAPAQGGCFVIDDFHTELKPDSQDQMVWQIGNHGFALRLSPQVPRHLAEVAPSALRHLCHPEDVDFWAIHPGGPAIVERLGAVFGLALEQLSASYAVLRRYGNLSSATILFVLEELRQQLSNGTLPKTGVAMAFGPGLVVEMARLTYLPAALLNGASSTTVWTAVPV